jgi:hypothetical protein
MQTFSFTVTDEHAERMTHESVYIDVFGVVRWTRDTSVLLVSAGTAAVHVTVTDHQPSPDSEPRG